MIDRTQTSFDPDLEQTARTRVFLCYSRKDSPFINRLATELFARGYAPDFDQSAFDPSNIESGISAQDEWWQRLQHMIAAADVILIAVSPDSAASKVCDEEIAYARNLSKRIIPVLCAPIDFAKAPPRLAALNVRISFIEDSGSSFNATVDRLCTELDVDVGWHRESRRLVQLAVRWGTGGRSADQLMSPADIVASECILQNRPRNADPPPQLLIDFLDASRTAQDERLRKNKEQIARNRRASNNLVGEVAEFHEREGVPLASTVVLLENAVDLVDGPYEGGTSDPGVARVLGLALAQLSEKKRLLNDFHQAERAAQRAVDIFERLSQSDPENPQYLDDLHVALDRLIDASDSDKALDAADRTLELAKALVSKDPTLERRLHYSISLSKYAYLIKSSDNPRAVAMYTEALHIQDDILKCQDDVLNDMGSVEYVRRAAALTRLNIGRLYCDSANFEIAKTWVLESLAEIGRLKADYPRTITYIQDEAAARELLGDILKHGLHMHDALAAYRESLAATERLSNADISNIELKLALLRAYDRVAFAVAHLGHGDEAIQLYTKGLRLALELGRTSPERNDWPGVRSLLESLSASLIKRDAPELAQQYVNETIELLRDLAQRNKHLEEDLAKVLGFGSYVTQFTKTFDLSIKLSADAIALSPTNWRIGVNRIHALLRAGDVREAAQYYKIISRQDSDRGRKITKEIESDLDAFRAAHLPQDFLLTLTKFVKSLRDEF